MSKKFDLFIHSSNKEKRPLESFRVSEEEWNINGSVISSVLIRARRHSDLIDLKFRLVGFKKGIFSTFTKINKIDNAREHIVIVEFPPQHLAETIAYPSPQGGGLVPPAKLRMSDPSRIAFDVPNNVWDEVDLTINDLTNWSQLKPRVNDRVKHSINSTLETQLNIPFSKTPNPIYTLAIDAIRNTLVGPGLTETSLEMSGRLLLSPSEQGRWLSPLNEPEEWDISEKLKTFENRLWNVRLDRAGGKTVRALWSRQLEEKKFPKRDSPKDEMSSLDAADHWEIIGQTSVYGLPALRSTSQDKLAGTHGNVIRPESPLQYLKDIDTFQRANDITGVLISKPFDNTEISLTALGGIFVGEYKGEPPKLLPTKIPAPWFGFDLQRLFYQTWLGRDSSVVAVAKGYLYPLGMPASFVTIHERRIIKNEKDEPISHLVKREFIVTSSQKRSYPGPYHPYNGRNFPPTHIQMKTLSTPDLDKKIGKIDGLSLREALWPCMEKAATQNNKEVYFEWLTDDGVIVKCPLIFVYNSAVNPGVLQKLENFYCQTMDIRLRTAILNGARTRYAEAKSDDLGCTSFDTDHWILGVSGRKDGDASSKFDMDGRMEGANQPPFYPFVERAIIGIQTVDQLLGKPNGRYEVVFHEKFLSHGFDSKHEIYLRLTGTGADVQTTDKPRATGGIAAPNMTVAAISRKIGLVGGESKSLSDAINSATYLDISDAENGKFNPNKFFKDIKLLGLFNLKDYLPVRDFDYAPTLIQKIGFGSEDKALGLVKSTANRLRASIYGNDGVREQIEKWLEKDLGNTSKKYKDLYPDLDGAIKNVFVELEAYLVTLEAANNVVVVANICPKILALVRPAIKEIERIIKDPVPSLLKQIFEDLRGLTRLTSDIPKEILKQIYWQLTESLSSWLHDAFCKAVEEQKLGSVLFGRSLACKDLKSPLFALNKVKFSLFSTVFGESLEKLLSNTLLWTSYKDAIEASLSQNLPETTIIERIKESVSAIENELLPTSALLNLNEQKKIANDVLRSLKQITNSITASNSIEDAAFYLYQYKDRLDAWKIAELKTILELIKVSIDPKYPPKLEELHAFINASLVASIEELVVKPALNQATDLHVRLKMVIEQTEIDTIKKIENEVADCFSIITHSVNLAKIAGNGMNLCAAINDAAYEITIKLVGDFNNFEHLYIDPIKNSADKILQKSPLHIQNIAAINGEIDCLSTLASRFPYKLPVFDMCSKPTEALICIAEFTQLRRDIVQSVNRIVLHAYQISSNASMDVEIAAITKACTHLYLDFGGVKDIRWLKMEAAVASIIQEIPSKSDVSRILEKAQDEAKEIRANLAKNTIGALASQADRMSKFLALLDRELAGEIFEVVSLSGTLSQEVHSAASIHIKSAAEHLWGLLNKLYETICTTIEYFLNLIKVNSVEEILIYLLQPPSGKNLIDELILTRDGFRYSEEIELLQYIVNENDSNKILAAAVDVSSIFYGGKTAFEQLVKTVAAIQTVNLGQNITNGINNQLDYLLGELNDLVRQFIPTKIETSYNWQTPISNIGDVLIWGKLNLPEEKEFGGDQQLSILSSFMFDIIRSSPETKVEGRLAEFSLKIASSQFHMVTVEFSETTFKSINGSAPDFDMKVKNVIIGDYLKFIEKLQQWLSPSGSGFYVTPILGEKSGVEAGYNYDAGIIQLGALQFINVSFRVAAKLFFDGTPANYIFSLASPNRPFLIACPPYGGGGFMELECDPEKIISATLSFVYGGVAALKFGPLNAQGRIVAGIGLRTQTKSTLNKKVYTITAIFEAVGEGNIACFSLCISIRISLIQHSDGALYGSTRYKFSFKLGWASISYSVNANYTISSGSNTQAFAAVQKGGQEVTPKLKAMDWQYYKKRFDKDMLEELCQTM